MKIIYRFIYQPLIEIYLPLIFFINGMLFDNLFTVKPANATTGHQKPVS